MITNVINEHTKTNRGCVVFTIDKEKKKKKKHELNTNKCIYYIAIIVNQIETESVVNHIAHTLSLIFESHIASTSYLYSL